TGGSGVAQGLPANFRRTGTLRDADAARLPRVPGPAVVLSGSASIATNGQVAAGLRNGRRAFRIDPLALARGEPVVASALDFIGDGETTLVYATSGADEVRQVQAELGAAHAAALVEQALGQIAAHLRERGTRSFVVAG